MKNNYKNIGDSPRNTSKCVINLLIVSISLLLICLSLWVTDNRISDHVVILKLDPPYIHTVSDKFSSFGLDTSLLRDMKNLPINYNKFINLARHLSPAYIRIGGTAADCLFFVENSSRVELEESKSISVNDHDITNFTITSKDFLSLYKFTQKAKLRMLFDLNVLLRNPDGTWNSDNAKKIILFAKGHGMELDWQMGNEPNSFLHVFNIQITAEQLAKDYCTLRTLLNNSGYEESLLVGPEANHIGDKGDTYMQIFLDNINDNCIDDITWHQYYLDGHEAQVQDFVNSTVFNKLPSQINNVGDIIKLSRRNISMWISETSSAFGGGAPKLSDRFVAVFLCLDKLGYGAKAGVQVIIRQSLFGGNYAMIDSDLNPNPNWWVTVIYKQFVSNKVLSIMTPDNFGNIRLYAHCASKKAFVNNKAVVTIYGMNLNKVPTKIYIRGPPVGSNISSYILTSDDLQSRNILLNGKILKLQSDGNLPLFIPKILEVNQPIELPPYSLIFLLLHNLEIPSCFEQ